MKEIRKKTDCGIIIKQVDDDYVLLENETFDNISDFIKPDIIDNKVVETATPEEIAEFKKSLIPQTAKNMKFRLELIKSGVSIKQIEQGIEAMPDSQQKEQIKTLWEFADFFERTDKTLCAMAQQFGISSEQLDQLFILSNEKNS